MTDQSHGYEAVAADFLARRGHIGSGSTGTGTKEVAEWAASLPSAAAVLDLGCGSGIPLTTILVRYGFDVFAVDAAPSLVSAFRRNLPDVPVACEAVEQSRFFDRKFDAILAWGLIFLLAAAEQRRLIERIATILNPGGRLLFTAPAKPAAWTDVMTGRESRSLGAIEYRALFAANGLKPLRDHEGEGQNHHFEAEKPAEGAGR